MKVVELVRLIGLTTARWKERAVVCPMEVETERLKRMLTWMVRPMEVERVMESWRLRDPEWAMV